jgi:hypothetical protein
MTAMNEFDRTPRPPMAGCLAGCRPAQECAATLLSDPPYPQEPDDDEDAAPPLRIHPSSQRFYELCDAVKAMHARKSADYGCPSGTDPLANIRNGAEFVGIEPWRAAMVRLSDKVTRLRTFNATGRLEFESVQDTLLDLASYSLLTLVMYEEDQQRG